MRWVHVDLLFLALLVWLHAAEDPCQVIFVNRGSKDLRVSWISKQGLTQLTADVQPGREHSEEAFCGHHFLLYIRDLPPSVVTVRSNGKAFIKDGDDEILVEKTGALLNKKQRLSGHDWEVLTERMRGECRSAFEGHPDDVAYFCDPKFDNRVYVESRQEYTEAQWQQRMVREQQSREGRNHKQPGTLRNFTAVGFEVRKLPVDLLTDLQDFYRKFRLTKARPEDHPAFDPNLSGRESDTWVLDLTPPLKEKLRKHLRPTLAEWSGVPEEKLKHTALYGMRFYHNGSKLYMHVDRRETHVLSAIVEVDHLGLPEDGDGPPASERWPLQILDHSGQKHIVPSNPGQVILYESATCAHGRPEAFHGREFANLFVHFAPLGWPEEYKVQAGGQKNSPFSRVFGALSGKQAKRDEI
mmetsp:Transcript_30309/g.70488  ORF Transcript_30309/g.70488 Transcript_30309/m.70488 type:complete len:412 (-) Transcript_30309:157-1392(-)